VSKYLITKKTRQKHKSVRSVTDYCKPRGGVYAVEIPDPLANYLNFTNRQV